MKTVPTPVQIYKPMLEEFCKKTIHLDIGDDFSSIFLPHVMNGYENAKRKIFYFGQDTSGWASTKELMKKYTDNILHEYINETSTWLKDHGYLDFNNYKPYGFWTLVAKLHLRIKGVNVVDGIGPSFYDSPNLALLNDFGYGNTNAIEIQESLIKRKKWDDIDQTKYWNVKEQSKIFDKLKYTIQIYNPDLIFIFNWGCDDKLFLEGLSYEVEKFDLVNNHFWVVTLSETKTKIIWTVHPNNLMFQGYNVDHLIDAILKFVV